MTLLTCPCCGGEMSLDVLLAHAELRQATFNLVEKSLALGSLVLRYVALFRPGKNRMSAERWARLILQLQPDLDRNAITHKGREWRMPLEAWKRDLETVIDRAASGKITLPLDNHNYLYSVLVGTADTAQAERETEDIRRTRAVVSAERADSVPGRFNTDKGFTSVAAVMAAQRRGGAS